MKKFSRMCLPSSSPLLLWLQIFFLALLFGPNPQPSLGFEEKMMLLQWVENEGQNRHFIAAEISDLRFLDASRTFLDASRISRTKILAFCQLSTHRESACNTVSTCSLILTLFPFEPHLDVFIRVVALEVFFPMVQESPHLDIPKLRYGPITEVSPWQRELQLFGSFGLAFAPKWF